MIQRKTSYYDAFACIASACPDSCCQEWAVQIDDASASLYRTLPGPLGDRLRETLVEEDGDTVLQIRDGRCPMWRQDGLCRIQAELGEEALCKTCREFPRLRHDYGDFVELELELSCPEAARLILHTAPGPFASREIPGGEAPEYDRQAMEVLLRTRDQLLSIITDDRCSVPEMLALVLLFGYQAQGELDGAESIPFDPEAALLDAREFAKDGDSTSLLAFFSGLEILTGRWRSRLAQPREGSWEEGYRNLIWYFVQRYWLQAVSDYDLSCRVKFMVISCLVIHTLGGNLPETAQLYSKEIENNLDSVEAILDSAYSCPAFTDDKLLGLLLCRT